ncbi:hypothetical protein TorRG33x02_304590 [Trema orientale]|uniref:Uncharacterized protein n=1 Tax=Trema orientale TaxID=63057 RepID=A0A2P5BY20_TREOI|nr:hypothetical protein TorRG33x02_304590 [Trema orientale]
METQKREPRGRKRGVGRRSRTERAREGERKAGGTAKREAEREMVFSLSWEGDASDSVRPSERRMKIDNINAHNLHRTCRNMLRLKSRCLGFTSMN